MWRSFLPWKNGGRMRRWIKAKDQLIARRGRTDHLVKGPITLMDFTDWHDCCDVINSSDSLEDDGWVVTGDEMFGGRSRSTATLIRTPEDFERVKRGDKPVPLFDEKGKAQNKDLVVRGFTPFVRWQGRLDTSIPPESNVDRSGFCAAMFLHYPFDGLTLNYNALELTCKLDHRKYTIAMSIATMFPDELYKCTISDNEPSGGFKRIVIPFKNFVLTRYGTMVEVQRTIDCEIDFLYAGITIMDGVDGDFSLDLAKIRVVNYHDGEIWGEDDDEAPY